MTKGRSRPLAERLRAATSGSAAPPDLQALADTVFGVVAADIPFAFACLATTDPASGLITAAYKSHPLPMGDEEFSAAEYGAPDINQFADLARRPVPVGVLSVDTDGQLDRCRRMRDYMTPTFGFTDEVRLVCRSRDTTWGLLALYRGEGEAPFTAGDGRLLATGHEVVADGVRRVLFAAPAPGARAGGGPAVFIVDAGDRVTDRTATADTVVDELGGWDHGALPASVLAVINSARATGRPTTTRVPTRTGHWLAVRAMPLGARRDEAAGEGPSVVLTIDTAPQAEVGEMTVVARGLTAREQEIVALVLRGASTKDIASTLFLSPHTVQDHLKAVFAKIGVNSRRELIAQLVLP